MIFELFFYQFFDFDRHKTESSYYDQAQLWMAPDFW